jgi:hypothetical protein
MINEDERLAAMGPLSASVATDFAGAVASGRLDLPLPGGGRTYERWAVLPDLAGEDLPWHGCPRDTPTRWPSWPSSAPARRRTGAAGASGPRSRRDRG